MRVMIAVLVLMAATVAAGEPLMFEGKPSGRILASGARRVMILDQAGKVVWEHAGANMTDCWMMKNGHVIFADGGAVTEVNTKTDETVFTYKPTIPPGTKPGNGTFSCQPLKNGNTLVSENSTGRILEVNRQGKIAFELKVEPFKAGNHHNHRYARKIKNGNYLVCHSGEGLVREYTPQGDIVFEVSAKPKAFSAVRLENGNTVVGRLDNITEFDPAGKSVWEFSNKDIDGLEIRSMCGVHVLPNGNLAVGVYGAYGQGGQAGLFEITRDKKIVWYYSNPTADRSMMSIQLLDAKGLPLPGETLR